MMLPGAAAYLMIIPLLLGAMGLTTALFSGESSSGDNWDSFRLLIAFDAHPDGLALSDRLRVSDSLRNA